MKNLLIILATCLCLVTQAQEVPIIKFKDLEEILQRKDDKIILVNFWATWCAPCIAELPLFQKLYAEKQSEITMYLINLDYAEKISRVNSFVKRKGLTAPVLLLDEVDYNSWIDKVDQSWSGAIPATLAINSISGKRKFVAKEMTEEELNKLIAELKNP